MPHPLLYKLLIINDLSPRNHRWLDRVHGPTRHTTGPTRPDAVHGGPCAARNAALVQEVYGAEDAEGGGKHYDTG